MQITALIFDPSLASGRAPYPAAGELSNAAIELPLDANTLAVSRGLAWVGGSSCVRPDHRQPDRHCKSWLSQYRLEDARVNLVLRLTIDDPRDEVIDAIVVGDRLVVLARVYEPGDWTGLYRLRVFDAATGSMLFVGEAQSGWALGMDAGDGEVFALATLNETQLLQWQAPMGLVKVASIEAAGRVALDLGWLWVSTSGALELFDVRVPNQPKAIESIQGQFRILDVSGPLALCTSDRLCPGGNVPPAVCGEIAALIEWIPGGRVARAPLFPGDYVWITAGSLQADELILSSNNGTWWYSMTAARRHALSLERDGRHGSALKLAFDGSHALGLVQFDEAKALVMLATPSRQTIFMPVVAGG